MKQISIYFAGVKPHYTSLTASGADLCACIEESIVMSPLQRILIPTGTYVEIPEGYEGEVRPRSGLSFNHGIMILNAPGTIDSDYRGEIKVPLINISKEKYIIMPMERIAQFVINTVVQVQFVQVSDKSKLSRTVRDQQGFGSSGKI